jgi:hypothetical protein
MDVAEAVGLTPLKVNVVLLRGSNDDKIEDFAAFARDTGRIVRFIEFMPLDARNSGTALGSCQATRSSSGSPGSGLSRRRPRTRGPPRPSDSGFSTSRRNRADLDGHPTLLWHVQSAPAYGRRRGSQLSLLRRRACGARSAARRRCRCRTRAGASPGGLREVPGPRHQRDGVPTLGAIDVDDRRLTLARVAWSLRGPSARAHSTRRVFLDCYGIPSWSG